jgi:DNA-binding PucR family transcriptional regulator
MAPLSVGISQVVRRLHDFSSAYRNAQHTLKTLKNIMPNERYLFFDDLEVKQLLINNNQTTLNTFLEKALGPLLSYEKRSKDEFLETLRIYIKSNGNWTYTKDRLHIHGNTLNYRLARIMALLNMDLNDYQQRLKVQIAFEILDIQKLH